MPASWPEEKVEYLKEAWGRISIPTIAKNLDKSVNAVKLKAQRLGLGAFLDSGEYITLCQLCKLLKVSYSSWSLGTWKRHGMPAKKKKVVNNSFRIIYMKDFWKWLERNKMLIDLARVEPGDLGPEPYWAHEKRKADIAAAPYKECRPWTPEEDQRLINLLNEFRYSYREISIRLKRTEGAINRRMKDLGLKQRPVKADNHHPWTDEETEILVDMYYKGYIAEVIAEKIPRGAKAINGKIERMVKEGKLRSDRCRPAEEQKHKLLKAGISYKKALPKEKWSVVERFLVNLLHYDSVAKKHGETLDINVFLNEYRASDWEDTTA